MLNEVKGQNPHEMTISEIHNTMVQIQMASTRILMAIDILLRVDGCAEEMEDPPEDIDGNELEIGEKVGFTIAGPDANNYLQGIVCQIDGVYWVNCGTPGVFQIDNDLLNLHKLKDTPEDDVADGKAHKWTMLGATDKSIWFCSRCVTVITDLEYRHLNLNGCCEECETKLEQYEKVEWRP